MLIYKKITVLPFCRMVLAHEVSAIDHGEFKGGIKMDTFANSPAILFVFYFIFLLVTLVASIISLIIHKRGRLFSLLAALLVPVLFFISFYNALLRSSGTTEIQYFFISLLRGDVSAVIMTFCWISLISWWIWIIRFRFRVREKG